MSKINVFIFIDSFGYELLKKHPNIHPELKYKKSVKMQFGYSSTAIPSILTGESPTTHGQFTFFYHLKNQKETMFSFFDSFIFKLIPKFISTRRRFRVLISRMFKSFFNIRGYFDLYAVPFSKLKFFHYSEMKDLFDENAFEKCKNLKDVLKEKKVKHFISNWRQTEQENFRDLKATLDEGEKEFIFAYFAGLDGVQHMHTKNSTITDNKIEYYKENLSAIFEILKRKYKEYNVAIFSDHGMTSLTDTIDLQSEIKQLGLVEGKDFLSFLDSTMARFWFYTDEARDEVCNLLNSKKYGKILSEKELSSWGIDFKDHRYGDAIFLLDPGVQLAPSDMGRDPLPGMHGYSPDHEDSDAIWLSNYEPKKYPIEVKEIYNCMMEKIEEV